MTFTVTDRDRAPAEQELAACSSDLALVFEPVYLVDFEVLHIVAQRVRAILRKDHPPAHRPELRLWGCLDSQSIAPDAW